MQDNAIHGAATDDIVRAQELGDVLEYAVEANTIIYQGAVVIVGGTSAGVASTPEASIAIAGAGVFVGFALKRADNRIGAISFVGDAPGTGASAAKRVRVQGKGKMVVWALGAVAIKADIYATSSNEFTATAPAGGHGYFVGRVAEITPDPVTGGLTRCVVQYDSIGMSVSA